MGNAAALSLWNALERLLFICRNRQMLLRGTEGSPASRGLCRDLTYANATGSFEPTWWNCKQGVLVLLQAQVNELRVLAVPSVIALLRHQCLFGHLSSSPPQAGLRVLCAPLHSFLGLRLMCPCSVVFCILQGWTQMWLQKPSSRSLHSPEQRSQMLFLGHAGAAPHALGSQPQGFRWPRGSPLTSLSGCSTRPSGFSWFSCSFFPRCCYHSGGGRIYVSITPLYPAQQCPPSPVCHSVYILTQSFSFTVHFNY